MVHTQAANGFDCQMPPVPVIFAKFAVGTAPLGGGNAG
ncbi:hypothetical protein MED193_06014 [Roseobacter sp. MED193]|nr:hypothetical protein MED193_06014 [Roseobacter sp. MED193]